MSKKNKKIEVKGTEITISNKGQQDYICLTDIARYKDDKRTDYIIQNWLRNRQTIEYLGIWEKLNNPAFNPIEFDGIRLIKLNQIAISQMKILTSYNTAKLIGNE